MESQFFTTLMNAVKEGVIVLDRDRHVVHINHTALNFLGIKKKEEILGKPLQDPKWKVTKTSKDPEPLALQERPIQQVFRTGKPITGTELCIHIPETDEVKHLLASNIPLFLDGTEKASHVMSVFEDTTEQVKISSKYQTIFDHLPLGIIELDHAYRFIEANQAFLSMMGYTLPELRKLTVTDITHPDDLEVSRNAVSDFNSNKINLLKLEKRYIKKNGETIWTRLNACLIKEAPDSKPRFMATIEDCTEQKSLEAKLIYSSKMSALGEMASGMSHEINNPLAIITGFSSVIRSQLAKSPDNINIEKTTDKLLQIEETVRRVSKIVKGLKTFAKSSESEPKRPVPISQIIDDTLSLCQERLKANGIEFTIQKPSDEQILCNSNQLTQVLLNLIGNSFDAIHKNNTKWIEIQTTKTGKLLQLSVTDSGTGINAPTKDRMMEPFFTTKEVGKGIGLGLSISKGIIDGHHGKLFYDPHSPNTRFVIELPIYEQ